jgi:hypothetical protein
MEVFSGFRALRPSWATPAAPVAPVRRAGSRQRERPSDHGELAGGSAERFVGPRGRKRGPASRSCPSCGCARLGRDRRRSGRSGETPQSQTGCARRFTGERAALRIDGSGTMIAILRSGTGRRAVSSARRARHDGNIVDRHDGQAGRVGRSAGCLARFGDRRLWRSAGRRGDGSVSSGSPRPRRCCG